ncbi:MAG TPA: S9 family peptidase [Usitatibacter sp.]|nr:S9 family peptidase [Usitatibacter sp.]
MPRAVRPPSHLDLAVAEPPAAARRPKVLERFGERRVDPYFWLRDKSDSAVIGYLAAENRYAQSVMKPLERFRGKLYREMLARIQETDESVPYRSHGYWYYQREVKGRQYPIHCRRRGSMRAPEEAILDVNRLARGHAFTAVGAMDVSRDGRLLAYTVDFTGFRQYTLHVRDLATGKLTGDTAPRVTSLAWAADGATLFYVEEHETTKRSWRLHRLVLGGADEVVYEEADELYDIGVGATRSEAFVVLAIVSKDTSEMRLLPAAEPAGEFRTVVPRRRGREYYVEHRGDELFIRTNDRGRNFRLVRAPLADPAPRNWRQVVAHRPLVMLEDVLVFRDFRVAVERDKGILKLRVTDFATGRSRYVRFDEAVYSAHPGVNAEFDARTFRFVYESLVTPRSWYDYDVRTGRARLLKRQPVLGGYDPRRYASKALTAVAKDGTRIPISLVYRKSGARGPRPMVLYGYGSYGIPIDPYFRSTRISLLDRGVAFAIAHVRGGGDRGRLWYDAGKLLRKKNTFTDFVACAESLVRRGVTAPDRLVIQGGSAGGLLMGAAVNMRPGLFRAVVSQVPFVDVVTTMLDASLPLTVGEYLEWGNPNERRHYRYMRSYSPYDNLKKGAYPAMLVETSLNDSQVMYWEPAKYVAKLRTLKTDRNPLLLKTVMEAGHGGASGRYDALRELAITYSFILDQVGLAK